MPIIQSKFSHGDTIWRFAILGLLSTSGMFGQSTPKRPYQTQEVLTKAKIAKMIEDAKPDTSESMYYVEQLALSKVKEARASGSLRM